MHELSIAMSLLDAAAEEAERHGGARVLGIHLKVGPLSGVIKEALQSAFELAREGSPLHEAELVFEDVPLVGYCPACQGERGLVSVQELCCVECGSPSGQIVRGRELEVTALEIQ